MHRTADRIPNPPEKRIPHLAVDEVLAADPSAWTTGARTIGSSREGRPILGIETGAGALLVTLIGGCHADEPVGPAVLERLVSHLDGLPETHALRSELTWRIVPHVNPDGEERNRSWTERQVEARDHRGELDRGYDLDAYLQSVVRELPGDDIEFGFPNGYDSEAPTIRPENRAVAEFLSAKARLSSLVSRVESTLPTPAALHPAGFVASPRIRPASPSSTRLASDADGSQAWATNFPHGTLAICLHGSFHGMGLAPGPWFLIERSWIDRTAGLRERLAATVDAMGYRLFDAERHGEKGFHRIAPGFTTRPDSVAMREFFDEKGAVDEAEKFRPSSMEFARSIGNGSKDPLTIVTEMPLFLTPSLPPGLVERRDLETVRARLLKARAQGKPELAAVAEEMRVTPMPIRDQMRLQLSFLSEALQAATSAAESGEAIDGRLETGD